MHFMAQSAPDIRSKIQKATAGPQTPMNNLFQLAYSVFNNRDTAEKAECTQRNMKKARKIVMALSAQRPTKGKQSHPRRNLPVSLRCKCPIWSSQEPLTLPSF